MDYEQEIFTEAKKYEISICLQTSEEQNDMELTLNYNRQDVHFSMPFPVPNTNGKWVTLGPVLLDVEIGGFKNTTFGIKVPGGMKGELFNIKEYIFSPPGAQATGDYSGPWWAAWLDDLNAKVMDGGIVPSLKDNDKEALAEISTEFGADKQAAKDLKGEEKVTAEKIMEEALQACLGVASPILDAMDDTLSVSLLDDQEFLQWLVLTSATPTKLGSYCHQASDAQVDNLIKLLKEDNDLLKSMIISGGAKGGSYGMACQIYHEIGASMQAGKSFLPKLQLAISLEFATPLAIFDTVNPVDPIQRYFDYEKAYLDGELDPAVEQFSVWELRMVVDCDASNEELVWARKMLFSFHPGIAYMGERMWRYTSLVKTDVKYGRPDWTATPRTMEQALCRGGQCGPRAWFGRFINKAFGNPTWGVVQPGHAAMAKWTPGGWFCILGGDVGRWGDRHLDDFKYETYIRKKYGDAHNFVKVDLLECIAVAKAETAGESYPRADDPWYSLACLQRKRLGDTDAPFPQSEIGQCEVLTKIEQLQQQEEVKGRISVEDDGTIVIPSVAEDSTYKSANFARSLGGGMQFNAEGKWWAEYKIPADMVSDRKKYNLTMTIASVHDNDLKPFQWIITSAHHSAQPMKEYSVPHPYTRGMWGETDPVEVEIGGGDEVLKLMRENPSLSITVKEIKLAPA